MLHTARGLSHVLSEPRNPLVELGLDEAEQVSIACEAFQACPPFEACRADATSEDLPAQAPAFLSKPKTEGLDGSLCCLTTSVALRHAREGVHQRLRGVHHGAARVAIEQADVLKGQHVAAHV